jgi:hypothetical protein
VLHDDLGAAIADAIGIDPGICRARAMQHSWDQSVREFHANLVPIRQTAYHFRGEGDTA